METLNALFASTDLGNFVLSSSWVWPIAEMFHFFGMSLLFATIGVLDLRILGVAKGIPIGQLERLVPWGVLGFAIVLFSGLMFVSAETPSPAAFIQSNLSFQIKMALVLLAGINVLAFYVFGIARRVNALGPDADAGSGAKFVAGLSLVLWIGVICFGRLIMYDATLLSALGL